MLIFTYFMLAVGVSFLCSILEAVLLSITVSHIELTKDKNPALGRLMEFQKDNIDFSIAAILTLNTFAHTLGAAGVGAEAAKLFGEQYMFYISAVLTLLILVLSEIIPKTVGAFYWKQLAGPATRIIKLLVFITYPILVVMNRLTSLIAPGRRALITKEEVIATASVAEDEGVLHEKERRIIQNAVRLREIRARDILTPRSVLFSVQRDALLGVFDDKASLDLQRFKEYSRVPVFGNSIDDIVGVVISKELFHELVADELADKRDIIKPVTRVNENIPVSKLIDMFVSRSEHLFIVCDRYDQTEGVVTLEDAVETLLGIEIVDELDSNVDMQALARARILRHRGQVKRDAAATKATTKPAEP
ncbi:CNNM domain-containing protein [Nitrogeniibacter aestuarii]|uniref:CNNM domain-containing protein n=1 Tax=Nitrogeniibacter aestuarii TaxID=2815343 RepID=UPI001D11CE18|nr:CNNM domain-containing protein [Nitrogeniibacter aestuarii]